ncbi:MAG: hypothetical protein LBH47_02545, partial [Christensenellaceae bacterium]|nr:hypothetical protein [Christensenellaceae bacterium]
MMEKKVSKLNATLFNKDNNIDYSQVDFVYENDKLVCKKKTTKSECENIIDVDKKLNNKVINILGKS